MRILLIFLITHSVYASNSLLTLQHMEARELQKAATLTYQLPECYYSHYQMGRVLEPRDDFYQGYYMQFWMQGDAQQHRQCLDRIRQKTAGVIRRLDSFLLTQSD